MKFIDDISNFIFLHYEPEKADIIFISGGSYPEIAEKAADIWNDGYRKISPCCFEVPKRRKNKNVNEEDLICHVN